MSKTKTMADVEKKSLKTASIVLGAITVLLFCMTYFGLFHTYLYGWHQKASGAAHIGGVILFALCGFVLLAKQWISDKLTSDTAWYVIWIILLVMAIATSCGFNFTLS